MLRLHRLLRAAFKKGVMDRIRAHPYHDLKITEAEVPDLKKFHKIFPQPCFLTVAYDPQEEEYEYTIQNRERGYKMWYSNDSQCYRIETNNEYLKQILWVGLYSKPYTRIGLKEAVVVSIPPEKMDWLITELTV